MTSAKMAWKKWTMIASLFIATALVCIPAVGQSKPGAPLVQTQSVLVVNGAGQPIPTAAQGTTNVAGTVNIGNSPSVTVANTPSVNVTNTPTVSLAAGGSVNVTNPPNGQNNPTPLAVVEATQPYEDQCFFTFSGGSSGGCSFHDIPSGKRLVIQEFDQFTEIETGLKLWHVVLVMGGGLSHYFTTTFMGYTGDGVSDAFATHQETHLYMSSGRAQCLMSVNGRSNGTAVCVFSGFLVDVP